MADNPTDKFPLLLFPQARTVPPAKGKGMAPGKPHFPDHARQIARLESQMTALEQHFRACVSNAIAGLEPETVLVIEIAGSVENFRQAIEKAGLEWLGEWDVDKIEPDDDFYAVKDGKRTDKPLAGRLFLSLSDQKGQNRLLTLWKEWQEGKTLPHGQTKWRDVFAQTIRIRRWGIEETLRETDMIHLWQDLLEPIQPEQRIHCQIEFFYRRSTEKRKQYEQNVAALLLEIEGQQIGTAIDMPKIAFHAVKVELPAKSIQRLLKEVDSGGDETSIQLFKFPGIMYFRPTGQSLAISQDEAGETFLVSPGIPELPPVAAILDGVPNLLHDALRDRLDFDDPDNLESKYQPGERKHGTAIASLIVHGELKDGQSSALNRKVYFRPVMEPDPNDRERREHVPDDLFYEDRIERAVRRMFVGEGSVPAQAPGIRIINLSIGDPERPFLRLPSPWARLLDWLAWEYRVLFCVSAGNSGDAIDVKMPHGEFLQLPEQERIAHVLRCIGQQLAQRRLLSPAESLNALTIGALHVDESGSYAPGLRTDLLPDTRLFSPASRFGHGFRRSVKPEILFPGGRQLYKTPVLDRDSVFSVNETIAPPGQRVAWDSKIPGEKSPAAYTRGTSNAAALATRAGIRIHDMLEALWTTQSTRIHDGLMAVLIKTLLAHGARHDKDVETMLENALKTPENSRRFKEIMACYLGYGAVDVERVLTCTAQRGTILGCGEIRENEIHEYRLPLPVGLSSQKVWRRMIVTLAWFTPINPDHRNLREAKLEFGLGQDNWRNSPLRLKRQDTDHHQVQRGTVQHEILEGEKQIAAYLDDAHLLLQVHCKRDATESLEEAIPYGLAVTLEVAEDVGIPIYQQLRDKLKPLVAVGNVGNS
jgi:hypothetical protein